MSLARTARRVKSTRVTARPDTPFGFGVTPRYTPEFDRRPYTISDERWLVEMRSAGSGCVAGHPSDCEYDRLAAERAFEDRYERGLAF